MEWIRESTGQFHGRYHECYNVTNYEKHFGLDDTSCSACICEVIQSHKISTTAQMADFYWNMLSEFKF